MRWRQVTGSWHRKIRYQVCNHWRSCRPTLSQEGIWVMKLGVKELIKLCIYCWGHPLLYTFSGSVAVWMLLSGNLQHWGRRCCPLVRRTSAVWKYSRQPNSTEPKSTKHHQRIWYCKTQDCYYYTHNLGNAESHLRIKHYIILEATNSPPSHNIRSLINQ
jgi:hypothetical protein